MERWWGRAYDRGALRELYGSLDARPLEATLARGKAHEQATALGALAAREIAARSPRWRGSSHIRTPWCATTPGGLWRP